MPRLSPEQFARVEALYFEASALDPLNRDQFVRATCADDSAVREEVLAMLAHGQADHPSLAPLAPLGELAPLGPLGALAASIAAPSPEHHPRKLLGSRVGAYEITQVIGQGGMGVVYRAQDSRLGRAVAVKSVPPAFADDAVRMSRFLREARLLASLSHPNIATIFDLAEKDGSHYLVMELIEGHNLAQHLSARGPMRVDEALAVCAQIAAALDAAHEADVVHRDLKPQNVMLSDEGRVKVLDFGLAREVPLRVRESDTTVHHAPAETREGAILGTPGYMSPEQVRGQPVDRRTDVFALGCILYECLTGKVAFPGETAADVAAGVLHREPNWDALPATVPPSIRRLLVRCTAKSAADRPRDMGDLRLQLQDALEAREWQPPVTVSTAQPAPPRRAWRAARGGILVAVAAAVGATAVASALYVRNRPVAPVVADPGAASPAPPAASAPLRKFSVRFPGDTPQSDLPRVRLALSRDGGKMVISAARQPGAAVEGGRPAIRLLPGMVVPTRPQLWVRNRDDLDFRPLPGTENAFMPSLSPDGTWAIYHDDRVMVKKRATGGNPVTVAEVGGFWGTYHWGSDDVVTYVPVWGKGVARVPATGGGAPRFVTTCDYARKEFAHVGPCVTPDNKTALFTVWNGADECRIEGVDLATGRRIYNVVEQGTTPRVARVPGGGHYLFYERSGSVFAAPFDLAAVRRTGPEAVVADGVLTDTILFTACYDVADDGTLAYVPGPLFVEESRLSWVNPDRSTVPFNDDRYAFGEPRFTADGKRLSVMAKGKIYGVHVYDLERGQFDRVVTDGDVVSVAISPDGESLAYSCNKDGPYALWVKRLRDGHARKVFDGAASYQIQIGWSPDSRFAVFSMSPKLEDPRDIFYVDLKDADPKPVLFATTPAEDRSPRFSPNQKWVAYSSNAPGVREVFLKSFPDGKTSRQVTVGGGDWPEWSPDGKTLYYRAKNRLYALPLDPDTGAPAARPAVVYDKPFGQCDFELNDYTIDPQGRLLIVEPSERGPKVHQINVVLNWWQALATR